MVEEVIYKHANRYGNSVTLEKIAKYLQQIEEGNIKIANSTEHDDYVLYGAISEAIKKIN